MPLTQAQKSDLEAAIFAYLATEGSRFARTVAAFKEEAQLQGEGNGDDNHHSTVSGTVLERTWAFVHHRLYPEAPNSDVPSTPNFLNLIHADCILGAIESGDVATVQLYEWIIGNEFKAFQGGEDDASPLYLAADNNHLGLVEHFVKGGHDMDVGDYCTSPLHAAARNGHVAIVQYLLEHGADKDKARDGGDEETPLLMAVEDGYDEVMRCLVEQGADKDKANNCGATPLYVAVVGESMAIVQYLVEQGADMKKVTIDGTSLLLAAARTRNMAMVQYLSEQGADKEKANNRGVTPFMEACSRGEVVVAEYLLDQGCDIDRADNDGMTALHHAAKRRSLAIAQFLFSRGAKLNAKDRRGRTPADLATRHPAFADAIRAEAIRRCDGGDSLKRDSSSTTTGKHEASKRPRIAKEEEAMMKSDPF